MRKIFFSGNTLEDCPLYIKNKTRSRINCTEISALEGNLCVLFVDDIELTGEEIIDEKKKRKGRRGRIF